jgi:HlyD family secretion protein
MSWFLRTCTLAWVLTACDAPPKDTLQGYAEADSVIVSAPQGGWISELNVQRGQSVREGDVLFALDAEAQIAERNRALAGVAQAEAQAANLSKGRRSAELAAIEASILEAEAQAAFANDELSRQQTLLAKGFTTRRAVQSAQSSANAARARVANVTAQLASAKLGARSDEQSAAAASIASAKAALAQADYALSQRQIRARVPGVIEDVLREKGEYAPAQGAVVQILPPGALKLKFFVPEARRAQLQLGRPVGVSCSGCPAGLRAKVTFIAPSAEFTPPIIYSETAREKLVWSVEARPEPSAVLLSPGQPVDIHLTLPDPQS